MGFPISVYDSHDFKCEGCGDCCILEKAVPVTVSDIVRIADSLGIGYNEFIAKYCFIENDEPKIRFTKKGCPFLADKKCGIHDVKPLVCELYPFMFHANIRAKDMVKDQSLYKNCTLFKLGLRSNTHIIYDIDKLIEFSVMARFTDMYMKNYYSMGDKDDAILKEHRDQARLALTDPELVKEVEKNIMDEQEKLMTESTEKWIRNANPEERQEWTQKMQSLFGKM